MKSFTDATGRSWTLTLNLGTAMTVKERLKIDLLQPEQGDDSGGPPVLTQLGTDEMLLGEVLCVMLEGQFTKHGVTEEDVRNCFDGQTLLAAQKAFYEELIDFFRGRGRNDRAKAVAKQMAMINAAVSAVETKLDAINIDETIRGVMSGASQEASDSEPTTSSS